MRALRGTGWALPTVVAALLMLTFGPAGAEQWYFIAANANGDRFYVDTDQLRSSGSEVRTWVRTDYKEPRSEGVFKPQAAQALDSAVMDCVGTRSRTLTRYFRDTASNVLGSENFADSPKSYVAAPPGSVSSLIVDFACHRGRELAAGGADALAIPPDIAGSDWREVASRPDGTLIYVAMNRINAAPDGGIKFFELFVYAQPVARGVAYVKSEIYSWMGSCVRGDLVSLGSVSFGQSQQVLFRMERPSGVGPVQPPPNSTGHTVIQFVCSQPATATPPPLQAAVKPDAPSAPAPVAPAPPPPAARQKPRDLFSTGTAWYVDAGYFVTAYHVIDRADEVVLYAADQTPLEARVAAQDKVNDVAILAIDLAGRKPRPLPLSRNAAHLGSHVFTIGYPHSDKLGVSPKVTSGEISGNLPLEPTKLLMSVPVQGGNSGGPLINMNGEVVGLVVEKLSAQFMLKHTGDLTENTNFALKARYINALLDDLPRLPTPVPVAKSKAYTLEELVAMYRDSVYYVEAHLPARRGEEARK
jgi:hypothetical protein